MSPIFKIIHGGFMRENEIVQGQDTVPKKEKISYALTNTGQTLIYGIITTFLLLYMTDYLFIAPAVAGLILSLSRIFDAINDPLMGIILDRTNTRFGKCRFYMLFTPIPVALAALLVFAPFSFSNSTITVVYITIVYTIFTMVYTANDIPYWSMSAVITTNPDERTKIVTITRIIGGMGSATSIALFWTINKLPESLGLDKRMSFFITVLILSTLGACLMLQGYFRTKERAKNTFKNEKFLANLKLIPKSRGLIINLIAGILMSVNFVGSVALTTYFVKWNVKEVVGDMASSDIMAIFTPLMGLMPGIAMLAGLVLVPALVKRFEKRNLLIYSCAFGIIANIISYFIGYDNLIIFSIARFFSFLPNGLWSGVTTIMIGDSVDEIQSKTGKRIEGTCFSLLTFISKFQNSINVLLTGLILSLIKYNGGLDPDITQQDPSVLHGIFVMVTIVPAIGLLLMLIPFIFYNFNKLQHETALKAIREMEET